MPKAAPSAARSFCWLAAVGKPAAQGLAGVSPRVVDHFFLFAALRRGDFDVMASRSRSGFRARPRSSIVVREQDELRRGTLEIELREKGVENLAG